MTPIQYVNIQRKYVYVEKAVKEISNSKWCWSVLICWSMVSQWCVSNKTWYFISLLHYYLCITGWMYVDWFFRQIWWLTVWPKKSHICTHLQHTISWMHCRLYNFQTLYTCVPKHVLSNTYVLNTFRLKTVTIKQLQLNLIYSRMAFEQWCKPLSVLNSF